MRFALYLGCTVPVRAMNYELSARRTAERLGIGLVDVEGFSCCGYPARALSWEAAMLMAANNLALAEEQALDVCTLCSACTSTLVEANKPQRATGRYYGAQVRRHGDSAALRAHPV
jgi:heterodisulfide reductase subunit B